MKKLTNTLVVLLFCSPIFFPSVALSELNQYRHFHRGKRYLELGEYDKAIEDFNRAIELEQNYVFAYAERGLAWEKKGDHKKALADFNKALEINPEYDKAYKYRALTWKTLDQCEKAIEDYNKAIELNPDDMESYYLLGSIYCRQKEEEEALQFLELALKNGFHDFNTIESDPAWDDLRDTKEFQKLIQKYRASIDQQTEN